MRNIRSFLAVSALALALGAPLLAEADATDDRSEENRQRLDAVRKDPQQYARLRSDLAVFQKLPADRQEAIRKLDRDLQDETPAARAYLERALERYADWLDKLPEVDRQSVLSAPDRKTRLDRIREIREKQWLARLPRATQERIKNASAKDRADLIARARKDEREQRAEWLIVGRNWDVLMRNPQALPVRFDQLPDGAAVREFVEKELRPLLTKDQEEALAAAEGKWPRFPRTLVELADSHPISLLGPIGPTKVAMIPPLQEALTKDKLNMFKGYKEKFKEAEGHWPEFGLVMREFAGQPFFKGPGPSRKDFMLPKHFTPSRPESFPEPVQVFIKKKLVPALESEEKTLLTATENQWPAYPRTVLDLSRKHNLQPPPGKMLPGRVDFWDRYRARPQGGLEPRATMLPVAGP